MSTASRLERTHAVPPVFPRGVHLLHDPVRNKGTAFTEAEREQLGLRGLLPPRPMTQDLQVQRVMENLARQPNDLARYIELVSLQDRNETLFYRVVMDHLGAVMPIIYTPTVGQACQTYGHIFRRPRGLYVSADDRGRVADLLVNWPHDDVRIVVVTDGERILGLGDLGAFGMGIPVGKLSLYTACAGIDPTQCLPVTLDVGTNNQTLLDDPLYTGVPRRRLRGREFDELFDELVSALTDRFPNLVVQLEDFATTNAFRLLADYRDRVCCFDDDIQGTGAVALAGILSALRLTNRRLTDCRFLFLGAGEAGIGIADTIVAGMVDQGLTPEAARRQCWFLDSKGLVCRARTDLADHKKPYAHDHAFLPDLLSAVEALRPAGLIGVSTVARSFTEPVVRAMARVNERPIVFALSNPTSKSECTARQAYEWSDGAAVFASGSPFDPVDVGGRTFVPGQGNNAYIFPGVGLAAIAVQASRVTDEMFYTSAKALASEVSADDLRIGRVYPSLTRIREVSLTIATEVAQVAYERGLARAPRPDDLREHVRGLMFEPSYTPYA